ncbi:MAG: ferrous iron transport protein A [Desulfovibrionaceae bacterium]
MATPLPLDQFPVGSTVRIETLCDCPEARSRLCAMGLTPGTLVRIDSNGSGPRRLCVRDANLVLGAGLCRKVMGTLASAG